MRALRPGPRTTPQVTNLSGGGFRVPPPSRPACAHQPTSPAPAAAGRPAGGAAGGPCTARAPPPTHRGRRGRACAGRARPWPSPAPAGPPGAGGSWAPCRRSHPPWPRSATAPEGEGQAGRGRGAGGAGQGGGSQGGEAGLSCGAAFGAEQHASADVGTRQARQRAEGAAPRRPGPGAEMLRCAPAGGPARELLPSRPGPPPSR